MATGNADCNLLFAVLAFQADVIDGPQFIQACSLWAARKDTALADILLEHKWLTPEEKAHVDFLLARKLAKHAGNAQASLAAAAGEGAQRLLATVADAPFRPAAAALPTPVPPTPESTTAYRPEPRARYTTTRLHAQGGIGQIWVARDEDLGRDVALKELRPERADNAAAWVRFVEEARVTGQLEHPAIVPVYELVQSAGADQKPFYTMRFVKGRTLHDAVREYHRKRQAGAAGALDLRELLTAFVTVCNAIGYAHARGVIHRDLKGQNVVLGEYGEVIVVDWGLAKVLAQPEGPTSLLPVSLNQNGSREQTMQGQVLGTPSYLAPEQAEGRVDLFDQRTDVYGLGAILYDVLTGQPPFPGDETLEVLRRVVREQPLPPTHLVAATPAALEKVCLKALAKKPADRYESALALAQEVQRWLADEPVAAYREPLAVRLGRWGRRHKALVSGAAALLVTAVVALAVGLVAVDREQRRTQEALTAEGRRRQQARQALDAMSSQVIADWLAQQKALTEPQKKFLEQALASYEEFAQDTGQDESTRAGVAAAYQHVGKIRHRLGQVPQAEEALRRSNDLYAQLVADFPGVPDHLNDLAISHNHLGNLFSDTGQAKAAEEAYGLALAIREQLATDFPAVPDYQSNLGASHYNMGGLFRDTGKTKEAEEEYRRALIIRQRLVKDFPTVSAYQSDLAASHGNLGLLFQLTGRAREAEAEYGLTVPIQQRLVAGFPTVAKYQDELATIQNNLGLLFQDRGQAKEAEEAYRQALASRQRLAADFPAMPDYLHDLAMSYHNLGFLFWHNHQAKEAEEEYRRGLAIRQRLVANFPNVPHYRHGLAVTLGNLALVLQSHNDYVGARRLFEEALPHYQAALKAYPRQPVYCRTFRNDTQYLVENLLHLGDHAQAALAADRLAEFTVDPAADAYAAAGYLAQCVPLAEHDTQVSETKRKELAQSHGDRALAALRRAFAQGYKDVAKVKTDRALEPLRSRAGFQKLLADWEEKATKDGK